MASSAAAIPLPPIAPDPRPNSSRLRQAIRYVEYALLAVALLFAFATAAFAVRNADFWLHLATGRLIANGEYHVGSDPFAYTTAGRTWVNHAWLFDLALFEGHRLLGDRIVILKALLVTLLAAVMVTIRRRDGGLGLPAVMTALAILAASPRLLLQPMLVSLLFEAVTLWLLTQKSRGREWLLPLLFAIWVNFDAWFLLGPVTLLTFMLGDRANWGRLRTRSLILVAGLAACLLNPHHVRAFQLPMELSPAVLNSPLLQDIRFQRLFESPWHLRRYTQTGAGLNPAGLSYFVLVGLGVISFLASRDARRDWRLPIWAGFAILGGLQLRLVPFFAVVAGPITAMNFQDWKATVTELDPRREAFVFKRRLFVRCCALLAGLLLIVLTWPGWLQATPHDLRRFAVRIAPDPSLERAVQALNSRGEHDVMTSRPMTLVFTSHPDVGPYVAWYCSGVKYTIDPRLALFTDAIPDYLTLSRAFNPESAGGRPPAEREFRESLHKHEIKLAVLYDPQTARSGGVFAGLVLEEQSRWDILFITGKAVVVGERGNDRSALDMPQLAYHPASPLPDTAGVLPDPPTTRRKFTGPATPESAWGDEAAMYLRYFDEVARRRQGHREKNQLAAVAANLIASAAGSDALTGTVDISLLVTQARTFVPFFDPGPPEAAFLAIRAARQGLATNPNDAAAWLALGQAYMSLKLQTREGAWASQFPLLDILRHVQIAAALENALRLNPDLILAHEALANFYITRGFLDAALEHRRRESALKRAAGALPDESSEAFTRRLDESEQKLAKMEKQVQDRLNQYLIKTANLGNKPFEQARTALDLGLARKALDDVLLKSDVRLFGKDGARLQLELELLLGQADRVRAQLDQLDQDDNREELEFAAPRTGRPDYAEYRMLAYDWYSALLGAAVGDYRRTDRGLRAIDERTQIDVDEAVKKIHGELAWLVAAEVTAATQMECFVYRARLRENRESREKLLHAPELVRLLRADGFALAGLLAVERGDPKAAGDYFTRSLEFARDGDGHLRDYAGRAAAEVMLERITPPIKP